MKKYTLICAAVCAAMAFTSCKSSESAYKQAYLKAKQQEELQQRQQAEQQTAAVVEQTETAVVTPLQEKAADNTQVMDNGDNVQVRQETVSVVNGEGLNNFSVVVGSFSLKANAEGLQSTLKQQGYNAQVVVNKNVEPAMYRVIATTFATKSEAAASRASLQEKFPGAWLLYAK
jgi:cell division septation protein DedD